MHVIGWPFSVLVSGDVAGGGPASIIVEWGLDPELERAVYEEQVDRVKCVGTWWIKLGEAGALGGDRISPDKTDARVIDEHQPEEAPNRLRWNLAILRIDPRAITILLNLLYQSELLIRGVSIVAHGADNPDKLTPHDYPPRWPRPPFAVKEDRVGRNVSIEVEFRGDLAPEHHAPVTEQLQLWSLVGALGGFREVVPLDQHSELLPDTDVIIEFDLVTLVVRDRGVHDAAYDVLVNMLVRTALSRAGIGEVSIG